MKYIIKCCGRLSCSEGSKHHNRTEITVDKSSSTSHNKAATSKVTESSDEEDESDISETESASKAEPTEGTSGAPENSVTGKSRMLPN
jgi:hypothetical protein